MNQNAHTNSVAAIVAVVIVITLAAVAIGAQAPVPKTSPNCTAGGCHDGYEKRPIVHAPVASKSCDNCHEVVDKAKHKFKLTNEMPALCADCHDDFEDLEDAFKFMHGPVAAGSCTVCHDVHASNHSALLIRKATDICTTCHEAIRERIEAKQHKHQPAVGDCSGCHNPHGSDNRMFLKAKMPKLCTDCHEEVGEVLEDSTYAHGVMKSEKSCSACHDPHGSNYAKILSQDQRTLCMACHTSDVKSGERTIKGIGGELTKNPNHHGPIKQSNCTACHVEVHGGENFRLLSANYPEKFYSEFDEKLYALCFKCHESDLVRTERTDKLTNFRNGDHNLHYLHINRKKGRTCRACHAVHASDNPLHLAESVPFGKGGWALPIRFKRSKSGGTCATGCHKVYGYDREKPVVNLEPEPKTQPKPAPKPAPKDTVKPAATPAAKGS